MGNSWKWTNCGNYARTIMVTAAPSSCLALLISAPLISHNVTYSRFSSAAAMLYVVWSPTLIYAWVFSHRGELDGARCLYNKRCCLHIAESLQEMSSSRCVLLYEAPEFKGKAPACVFFLFLRRKKKGGRKSHMSNKAELNYCSSQNKKLISAAFHKRRTQTSSSYFNIQGVDFNMALYLHVYIYKKSFKISPHVIVFLLINSSPSAAAFNAWFYGGCLRGLCLQSVPLDSFTGLLPTYCCMF